MGSHLVAELPAEESVVGAMTLTRSDRCDACPAQAFVVITHTSHGTNLLFCGHHYAKNEAKLVEQGWHVADFRHLINDKPSASSPNADGEAHGAPF
jgi:hypothetical protein